MTENANLLQKAFEDELKFIHENFKFPYESVKRGDEVKSCINGRYYKLVDSLNVSLSYNIFRDYTINPDHVYCSNSQNFYCLSSQTRVFSYAIKVGYMFYWVPKSYIQRDEGKLYLDRKGEEEVGIIKVASNYHLKSEIDYLISIGEVLKPADRPDMFYLKHDCTYVEDKEAYYFEPYSEFPDALFVQDTERLFSTEDAAQEFYHNELSYVEGEGWYTDGYARDNFYYHEYDGSYRTYPDYDDEYGELDCYEFAPEEQWGYETKKKGRTSSPVNGQLYYGLELEYEIKDNSYDDDTIERLKDTAHELEFGACSDGSLRNGLEFKSKPLCISLAKKRAMELINKVKSDITSKPSCGIHVHISKQGLTLLQIGLIQDFIYNSHNDGFLNALSGRSPNTYCQRDGGYSKTSRLRKYALTKTKINKDGKGFRGGEKYEALNFQHNHTIEFRLFRSSVREHRVIGRIEFVQALVQYTSNANRLPFHELRKFENFVEFVKKAGRKRFPMLLELMYEKELLTKPPQKGEEKQCA